MKIETAQEKRNELEMAIKKLLLEFEGNTGLVIESVQFSRYRPHGPVPWSEVPQVSDVEVVIKL